MSISFFIKTFLLLVCSLAIILGLIGELKTGRDKIDIDSQYYNADGDHLYYERSLIEKKHFHKQFPHISIRKFSDLFLQKFRKP